MSKRGVADRELKQLLKQELNTSKLVSQGRKGGGYINEGSVYDIDTGRVFIKVNSKEQAKAMFDGEVVSLDRIDSMDVVKVPSPVKVITIPSGGAAFVMENLDIVGDLSSHSATLGEQVARLHLKNAEIAAEEKKGEKYVHKGRELHAVGQFGFDVPTCCGYISQNNEWLSDWDAFYARKVQQQITLLQQEYNDREASSLWEEVMRMLPQFFAGLDVFPALLHGDLWKGNAAEIAEGPVTFDPASFYGHSEFELSISHLFGGFSRSFFDSYHKIIPKADGYEKRLVLYKIFHYLNHWNHFGESYKGSSLSTLRQVAKMKF